MQQGSWTIRPCPHRQSSALAQELGITAITASVPVRPRYGVAASTLERLADEGCGLVLTVDCGITATQEIAAAKARGLDVIVTDHHRPADDLPDCALVATRPSDYPFPELCGTGVVYKLGQ